MANKTTLPSKKTLFRNIAISFVVVAAVLAIVVGYTAFSRAIIDVKIASVQKDLPYRILLSGSEQLPSNAIAANFAQVEVEETQSIPLSPDTSDPSIPAGGIVTLHNETSRSQLLVATTRLATPDGLIFRIQDRVVVPENGTVEAVVKADEAGVEYLIEPTTFTIPGLNDQLQKSIYATSDSAMVPGGAEPATVTETDLLALRQKVKEAAIVKAKDLLKEQGLDVDEENMFFNVSSEDLSNEVGEEAKSLTMTIKANVTGVQFDENALRNKIIETANLGGGVLPSAKLDYEIQDYDAETESAAVVGTTSVGSVIDSNSSIFAKANFVGATPEEAQRFLLNYEGIEAVDITLSPYWQKRLPRSSRRIDINFIVE